MDFLLYAFQFVLSGCQCIDGIVEHFKPFHLVSQFYAQHFKLTCVGLRIFNIHDMPGGSVGIGGYGVNAIDTALFQCSVGVL